MRKKKIKTDHKNWWKTDFSIVMQWVGCLYEREKNLMLPRKEINLHPKNYPRGVRCENLGCLFPQMCPEF